MPILAFTPGAVPEFFLLYALQIFKAILPSQSKYCVTVLEIIQDHTGSIFTIYLLHYIIRDHTGNCFRCKITKQKQEEKQAKTFPK